MHWAFWYSFAPQKWGLKGTLERLCWQLFRQTHFLGEVYLQQKSVFLPLFAPGELLYLLSLLLCQLPSTSVTGAQKVWLCSSQQYVSEREFDRIVQLPQVLMLRWLFQDVFQLELWCPKRLMWGKLFLAEHLSTIQPNVNKWVSKCSMHNLQHFYFVCI